MSYFTKDEIGGRESVKLFCSWLSKYGKSFRAATINEQRCGIDIITSKQKVEIKTTKKFSQIAIEEIGDCGKPGWIYTTQSSIIVFVNVKEKFAWAIPTVDLRKYYNDTKNSHGLFNSPITYGDRGDVYISKHRWYCIDELVEKMNVIKLEF